MVKKCIFVLLICSMCLMIFDNSFVFARDESRAGLGGGSSSKGDASGDGIFEGANGFISEGENAKSDTMDETTLANTSNSLYNILFAIAMVIAVALGVFLGIKFMVSSVEEQAKIKELLIPYVAGCIVIFGAIGIWKLAVTTFAKF